MHYDSSRILVMLCASREEICRSPQSLLARISSLAPTLCRATMDNCDVTEGIYKTNEAPPLFASIDGTAAMRHTPRGFVASTEHPGDVPVAPRTSQHSRDAVGSRSFHQKWSSGQDSGKIPMNYLVPKALCTIVRMAKTLVI